MWALASGLDDSIEHAVDGARVEGLAVEDHGAVSGGTPTCPAAGSQLRRVRQEDVQPEVRPPGKGLPGLRRWHGNTCRTCSAGLVQLLEPVNPDKEAPLTRDAFSSQLQRAYKVEKHSSLACIGRQAGRAFWIGSEMSHMQHRRSRYESLLYCEGWI